MSLRELAKKAEKINIGKLALIAATGNLGLISNNVRKQLESGIAGDGSYVGKYKSLYYARKKRSISKAPFGVVDLKLTGLLYSKLNTTISGNKINTDSGVDYSKYQIKRYGRRIYENTDDNKEIVRSKNSRDTIAEYKRELGI